MDSRFSYTNELDIEVDANKKNDYLKILSNCAFIALFLISKFILY